MVREVGVRTPILDSRGRVVESVGKVQTSVTSDMASQMVALYESGASAREVARIFNVHRQTVARHLRSSGVKVRRQGLTEPQTEQAKKLYLAGLTLAQVGERFGVSQGTIGRCLRRRGVKLRPPLISATKARNQSRTQL